jgi:hypothetical protein
LFNNLKNSYNIKLSKLALTIKILLIKRVLNSKTSYFFLEKSVENINIIYFPFLKDKKGNIYNLIINILSHYLYKYK